MKTPLLLALAPLALVVGVHAATPSPPPTGVSVSTDPAKAEEVEQHAQEIAAHDQASSAKSHAKTSHAAHKHTTHKTSSPPKQPAT
jgi:hypothetical protein